MRVALGSDHGGFELKQEIIKYLEEKQIAYKDYGCHSTRTRKESPGSLISFIRYA